MTRDQLTGTATIVGTLRYMAPEQLGGRDADGRTDIWGFGCVLYEMITGRKPFEGATPTALTPNSATRIVFGCSQSVA